MRPPALGSIGATGAFWCIVAGKPATFDGTVLGLVRVAWALGTLAGETVRADFGAGYRTYRLTAEPKGARPGGIGVFAEQLPVNSTVG